MFLAFIRVREQRTIFGRIPCPTSSSSKWSVTWTYCQSAAYLDPLRFVSAMREFAPCSTYLLPIQRTLIRFSASKEDWEGKFARRVSTC